MSDSELARRQASDIRRKEEVDVRDQSKLPGLY